MSYLSQTEHSVLKMLFFFIKGLFVEVVYLRAEKFRGFKANFEVKTRFDGFLSSTE